MPLLTEEIDFLRTLIVRRSGNVLSTDQSYLLESRLGPVALDHGMVDVSALVTELRKSTDARLAEKVTEALTINETSFFRDTQPFDALRDVLIPEFVQRRSAMRKLTIWSAASSSGQEAYSIAMLIRESFPELADWNVKIVATDLSDKMVARSQDGKYTQFEVNRGLPARLLIKYFDRSGATWQAKDELRRMIDCRKLNLMGVWPLLPAFDIVFLRNVLIYFDQPSKIGILEKVRSVMQADGKLFLGGGETLINLAAPFTREPIGKTVCFVRKAG